MSETFFSAFQLKHEVANRFETLWCSLNQRIYDELCKAYRPLSNNPSIKDKLEKLEAELREMTPTLERALKRLLDGLYRPELVLATTGTTSSGKSALVNLLCGAEIMPVAFDEMSAGVVSIKHGPSRTLRIHQTPGAEWETGTWTNLSDDDICERLRSVMRVYHRLRQEIVAGSRNGKEPPACPRSELEYPTYIGNHPELIGLPKCCRIRILDLPGLKYVGDESNSQVIRESREALCFVTYNSSETDPIKQRRLLEQVVDQVKELGGSPARMLFILNRIDTLRLDDKEWPQNEHAFVARMKTEITQTLSQRLPEYASSTLDLRMVRLSTLPALYALYLKSGHAEQLRAARELDKHFNSLIPEEVKDDLPRRPEKWAPHQCQRVGEEVWSTSYAEEFFQALRHHVENHFPDLVVPQVTDRFRAEAGAQVTKWAVETASAELNSSRERYEKEYQRITTARAELQKLCEASERQLQEPFDQMQKILSDHKAEARDLSDKVRDTLNRLQKQAPFNQLPPERLNPLSHWQEEMGRKRSNAIEAIACILQERDNAPEDIIDNLPPRLLHEWHTAIRRLANAGYTADIARRGRYIETRDETEKQRLYQMNQALNDLAELLSKLLELVMEQAAAREQRRVLDALLQLVDIYWKDVMERAQKKLQELGLNLSVFVPRPNMEMEKQELTLSYRFVASANLSKTTREEDTGKRERVQVGMERRWYTLWLYEHSIYKEKPIYEKRTYDTADVPSAEKLLENWDRHARQQEPALVLQFIKWILNQLNQVSAALKKSLQELMDRHQVKLSEAHESAKELHVDSMKIWTPILEQAKELHQCLEQLCVPPSRREEYADARQ